MKYLLLLLLCACQTDAIPDRLTVAGSHGDYDFDHSGRSMEGNAVTVGLEFDLTKPPPASDTRYDDWLWQKQEAPGPVKAPEPASLQGAQFAAPEPTKPAEERKPLTPADILPLVPGLLLAIAGALLKEKH